MVTRIVLLPRPVASPQELLAIPGVSELHCVEDASAPFAAVLFLRGPSQAFLEECLRKIPDQEGAVLLPVGPCLCSLDPQFLP